jgi:hypothetical protein
VGDFVAKLHPDPIGQADLVEFLETESDLAFEMIVLKTLIDNGFSCDHGGSYTDRVTNKLREFDIRARKRFGECFLYLAVECKNLRSNYPLLVSCVPRRKDEAFHEVLVSVNRDVYQLEDPPHPHGKAMSARSKNIRLRGSRSFYHAGKPVGKSCVQVGRTPQGQLTATDADIYSKWSQALSSADELTYLACGDGEDRTGTLALSLIFAILVVPDDRLWAVEYDVEGNRIADPHAVNRCSYFVHVDYEHPTAFATDKLTISHLELVTLTGLDALINEVTGDDSRLDASYPFDILRSFPELRRAIYGDPGVDSGGGV